MISREAITHVAGLAKLELTAQEIQVYTEQLSAIIEHFEQLSKVDVTNVTPLMTPTQMTQHLRLDKVEPNDRRDEILNNAPEKSGHLYKVPPVV